MSNIIINPDKTITIDGKKVFMVGLYHMCIDEGSGGIMKECNLTDKTDFILNVESWPPAALFNNNLMYWTIRSSYTSISTIMNKSMFFGYMMADEPVDSQIPTLQTDYTNIKSIDNSHPIILNHYKDLEKWYPYCDILTWDTYMVRDHYYGGSLVLFTREDSIYAYETHCKNGAFKVLELNQIPKPVWAVIQGTGGIDSVNGTLVPTPQEARATTYSAICMDVKGISFWSYHIRPLELRQTTIDLGLYGNQSLWIYYKQIAKELRTFNDILILPTQAYSWYGHEDNTSVLIEPNNSKLVENRTIKRFSYILKKSGNVYYLIVVNKDSTSISNVSITVPMQNLGIAKTLGLETIGSQAAGRILNITNGKFIDSFDSYAVHIYEITQIPCTAPVIDNLIVI